MDNIKDIIAQAGIERKQRRLHVIRPGERKIPPKVTAYEIRGERIPVVAGACSACRGAGYLRASVPYGHPNFGKALPCTCKIVERKKQRQWELTSTSGILSLEQFESATFETFD